MKLPKNRSLRRMRRLMWSRRLWRTRLAFWSGAVFIGLVASAFAMVADRAQDLFVMAVQRYPYSPLLISPLLFALAAWLTKRFVPASVGSGIPQVIAARVIKTRRRSVTCSARASSSARWR